MGSSLIAARHYSATMTVPPTVKLQSLLDTDVYKLTMQQAVLHHFPEAQVTCAYGVAAARCGADRCRQVYQPVERHAVHPGVRRRGA